MCQRLLIFREKESPFNVIECQDGPVTNNLSKTHDEILSFKVRLSTKNLTAAYTCWLFHFHSFYGSKTNAGMWP